jgi:hypothetical protein
MAIRAKAYSNKAGKADNIKNRAQVTMDMDDVRNIAAGDKAAKTELVKAIKSIAKE